MESVSCYCVFKYQRLQRILIMLKIENISFRIGGKALFESGTAMIPHGHKVGIVGRNGIGKSTLFNLIRGESQLESGSISVPSKSKIGSISHG